MTGQPIEYVDNIPVVPAYLDTKKGGLVFWCEYCRQWHLHSCEEGHRVAHCVVAKSPYLKTGYILKRVGILTPEIRKQHKQRLVKV